MFWGYTPALDLHKELTITDDTKVINILTIGMADARHIIKTISQSYKYEKIRYNFYVCEKWMEQVARQVLFFNILLEPETELGLFERIRLFLELYGNTIIRPPVYRYLYKKASQLINVITDEAYAKKTMPLFNFNCLKFRERDYMENIFKFWAKPKSSFNIQDAWDFRVRKALGTRYDNRKGVFDWDYHMRLTDIGAGVIFSREYINWRESGIAFTWLETDGSKPNVTLAAGILANGMKLHHHGYLGDITIGPFISYGIECDDENMLTQVNHEYKSRSTDVSEYNLGHMIHEIVRKEPFTGDSVSVGSDMRCAYMKFPELKLDLLEGFEPEKYDPKTAPPLTELPNVSITFMSMPVMSIMHHKEKYKDLFDLIMVSNDYLENLTPDSIVMLKDGGKVLMETQKFLVNLTRDSIKDYGDCIKKKADDCGLKLEFEFDPSTDSYARYIVRK